MKASELIDKLRCHLLDHGDLEVGRFSEFAYHWIDETAVTEVSDCDCLETDEGQKFIALD